MNGIRDGYGVQVWKDGAKYEGYIIVIIIWSIYLCLIGEWKNNKAEGKGKFYHVDGDIFDGIVNFYAILY